MVASACGMPSPANTFVHLNVDRVWVNSLTYSPDGKTLASGGWFGTVRLWDPDTGGQKLTFDEVTSTSRRDLSFNPKIAVSPDGKTLVSVSWDHSIRLWDITTGELARSINAHSSWINSIAYSPDGKRLVSGSWDGAIRLWDKAAGTQVRTLQAGEKEVISVAYSPDGSTFAGGNRDGSLYLWDAGTGVAADAWGAFALGYRCGIQSGWINPCQRQVGTVPVPFVCGM